MSFVNSRRLALSLCAAVLAVTVTACGSSSSATSAGTGSSGPRYQARVNLAKCMRSHGIDVPDPTAGGGGLGGEARTVFNKYPQSQIQAALQGCRQYVAAAFPAFNLTPQQRQQFQQEVLKFAQCMRSHGVNVPDPTFNSTSGPGLGFGIRKAFGSVDRNSPAFLSALTACQSLRPKFGRGGAGGPGGPPPSGGG